MTRSRAIPPRQRLATRRQLPRLHRVAAARHAARPSPTATRFLDARFTSSERVNDGTGNSSNDEGPGLAGAIDVVAGDRLPLIPRQTFKASLAVAVEARTTLALDLVATSGAPARGNENGAHAADGVFYLGPGRSPGYAVVNFGATMQTTPALTLFARIANVLDRRYASAAQLGPTGFYAAGGFMSQPFPADAQCRYPLRNSTFYAAGAPRLFSLGLRYAFD